MATFQERFKGKTTLMPKDGLDTLIQGCNQPIAKKNDNLQINDNIPSNLQTRNIQYQQQPTQQIQQIPKHNQNPQNFEVQPFQNQQIPQMNLPKQSQQIPFYQKNSNSSKMEPYNSGQNYTQPQTQILQQPNPYYVVNPYPVPQSQQPSNQQQYSQQYLSSQQMLQQQQLQLQIQQQQYQQQQALYQKQQELQMQQLINQNQQFPPQKFQIHQQHPSQNYQNMNNQKYQQQNEMDDENLNYRQVETHQQFQNKQDEQSNASGSRSYSAKNQINRNQHKNRNQQSVDGKQDQGSYQQKASSSNSHNRYRPYTLREYEQMKKTANTKLGGLGPNLYSDDWVKEKEKVSKRQEFAEMVRQFNQTNVSTSDTSNMQERKIKEKDKSNRQKAIEFAKNIPKPPPKKQSMDKVNEEQYQQQVQNEMDILERQHLQYLEQLDKFK